jgi:hypothetical protein
MKESHAKIYIISFVGTLLVFFMAFIVSNHLTNKKTEELKATEDKIAIDILSLETQYELLKESSCKTFDRTRLREELDILSSRLEFMEDQLGDDNPEVFRLKRYYSILQIKDYVLLQKMTEQCDLDTIFILYFYANNDCSECKRQEYMLQAIRYEYPQIEIYSFDYDVDLSAVKTLINLHNIPPKPPVIDIQGKAYASFDSLEGMEYILNQYVKPTATSTQKTATSTLKTIKK